MSNFESLNSFVKGYGTTHNPTKVAIKIEALEVILANSKKSVINIDTALPAYTNAVSARESELAPLGKIITRVNNAIKATDTTVKLPHSAGCP